ncbi:MAG: short-chain-enoyl-CoA hydratase [Carboxydocellales bacterium]
MEFNNLLIEKDAGIAIVTINRPKALNALNAETLSELSQAFAALGVDNSIKVIILTGSGDKAFVAGADISYMRDLNAIEGRNFALLGQRVFSEIENLPKPVIAAINGFTLGGGCELAMSCDIRIASEMGQFGQPEVNLGVIPGFAGTQRLPRLIGKGIAKEMLYTGDMIGANDAFRMGLVNKVVPVEQLLDSAKELAQKIASKSTVIIRLCKDAVNKGLEMDLEKAIAHEANLFGLCFATEDQKEGMSAFLEKRPAQFKDK